MTSEQKCPLCREKLVYYNVQYRCCNIKCFFFGNMIHSHEIDLINSQIARIKQEAFESGQKSVQRHRLQEIHPAHFCTLKNCERERYIHKLKQEAKQEIASDLDNSVDLCTSKDCNLLHYVFTKGDWNKIKKKHGVE